MRGKALANRRKAAGLKQREVADRIMRADGSGKPIHDTLLSQIEQEAIRLPRGFSAEYLRAVEEAIGEKARAHFIRGMGGRDADPRDV